MTYHVARLGRETASNLFYATAGLPRDGEGDTATIDRLRGIIGTGSLSAGAQRGPMISQMLVAGPVDRAARKIAFPAHALSYYDSFPDNRLRDARLRAYRVANGRLIEAGETVVTSSAARILGSQTPGDKMTAPGAGRFVWSMDGYNQRGHTRYYAVAAVDAAGRRGPWSNVVSHTFGTATASTQQDTGLVAAPKSFDAQVRDAAIPAPAGLTATGLNAGMTVQLDWTPVPGMGHVVAFSYHPEMVADEHMIVADASFLREGDLLIATRRFDHTVPKAETLSPRVWGAGSVTYRYGAGAFGINFNEDVAAAGRKFEYREENGTPYVRVTIPAGYTQSCETYTHSGTAQTWYAVFVPGTTRRITARLRAVGSPVTTAEMAMSNMGPAQPLGTIGTQWQTVQRDFVVPAPILTDSIARSSRIVVRGPAVLDFEWMVVHDPARSSEAISPQMREMLLHSGCDYIRQHALIKSNPFSYVAEDILAPLGPTTTNGESLTRFLEHMRDLRAENGGRGLNPWIQVEGHLSDEGMKVIAGALCTPYDPAAPDGPFQRGAKMRVDAGQVAPWQDVFDRVMAEVGNENWNPLSAFYRLPDIATATGPQLNGLMLDRLAEAIFAAPGCKPERFRFYLGGWAVNDGWNRGSALASRHADYIGYADYNGGWDSGLSAALSPDDPKGVFDTLANSNIPLAGETRGQRMAKLAALCREASVGRAKPIRGMHYEAGPGYVLNGLNGSSVTAAQAAKQELLMKSVAAGTATLDAFLLNKALGLVSSNFFMIQPGDYWTSAARPERGGAMNAPFLWTSFANRHLRGGVRKLDGRTAEALFSPEGKAAGRALSVYQVARTDGRTAYLVANLDPDRAQAVKLRLRSTRAWVRHAMTGDLKTTNTQPETKDAIAILAETMPAGWGASTIEVTIPPGKVEVYIEEAA